MRAHPVLPPPQFAWQIEQLFLVAKALTRVDLGALLATIEAEQHVAVLGAVNPTELRVAIEGAATLARLAPLSGITTRRQGPRHAQDDAQPWREASADKAQPARTKRGVC